ncbi:hypothetical protein PtA15_9A675 [Puccinia triticina]|uniref:Uncharacterized protein n=1 Tax=Puccinia triticina TaxID=208348 RepID=A0ABY7CUG0_9BASI|nr:uncharacterized protein PtA15_9A675 [Puccinia triticina]WAQ88548.1 hypothetical protein PtA15_9A675 [Puccinia triticina]
MLPHQDFGFLYGARWPNHWRAAPQQSTLKTSAINTSSLHLKKIAFKTLNFKKSAFKTSTVKISTFKISAVRTCTLTTSTLKTFTLKMSTLNFIPSTPKLETSALRAGTLTFKKSAYNRLNLCAKC